MGRFAPFYASRFGVIQAACGATLGTTSSSAGSPGSRPTYCVDGAACIRGLGLRSVDHLTEEAAALCLQWLPQIATTWRLGHLGSLSPASLFFTTPYTWIFGLNMIIRVGIKDWSAWIVYVLVGTMQLVLIGFTIIFKLRPSSQQIEGDGQECDKINSQLRTHAEMSQLTSMLHDDERCLLLAPRTPMSEHQIHAGYQGITSRMDGEEI